MMLKNFNLDRITSSEQIQLRKFTADYYGKLEWHMISEADLPVFVRYIFIAEMPFNIIDIIKKACAMEAPE